MKSISIKNNCRDYFETNKLDRLQLYLQDHVYYKYLAPQHRLDLFLNQIFLALSAEMIKILHPSILKEITTYEFIKDLVIEQVEEISIDRYRQVPSRQPKSRLRFCKRRCLKKQ